jgi:hypothetical protein
MGSGALLELLEPGVLVAATELLQPSQPAPVILKACKLLKWCADSAGHDHLPLWHSVVFRMVPLLKEPAVCEGVLVVLGSLAEHMAFKNMFMAAGRKGTHGQAAAAAAAWLD